jgi:predicted ATPase
MKTLSELRLDGLLSFAPGSSPFSLQSLNVLIGPNASGKSNLIESIELLKATSTNFAGAIRDGGGASEWLWKGEDRKGSAEIEAILEGSPAGNRPIRYRLEFTSVQSRVEILDEAVEEKTPIKDKDDVYFYYRFQRGNPVINLATGQDTIKRFSLKREDLLPDQSVLAQRRDPDRYPVVSWVGQTFSKIQTFREWTFGRYAALRQPQKADLPDDYLLPDAQNLPLIVNQIEHVRGRELDHYLGRFLPRFERLSTRVSGGTVQFFLHESGLGAPIPATRLSDGTIRFVALLAILLSPVPPPLICIEEPELGLHPDAVSLLGKLLIESANRMQIVVTTHSDALVSALNECPESVIACERLGAGTTLRRLDRIRLADWLEKYRLGDLWRMGELGANP